MSIILFEDEALTQVVGGLRTFQYHGVDEVFLSNSDGGQPEVITIDWNDPLRPNTLINPGTGRPI